MYECVREKQMEAVEETVEERDTEGADRRQKCRLGGQ